MSSICQTSHIYRGLNASVFLLIFSLLLFPVVSAYEITEGYFDSVSTLETENTVSDSSSTTIAFEDIGIVEGSTADDLVSVTVMMDYSNWAGSTEFSFFKQAVTYQEDGESETIGTGYMYYWLMDVDQDQSYDQVYVKCYFDDGLTLGSGARFVNIISEDMSTMAKFKGSNSLSISGSDTAAYLGRYSDLGTTMAEAAGLQTATHLISFYNSYDYFYDDSGSLFTFNLYRSTGNLSMLYVYNSNMDLINESSTDDSNVSVYSDDLTNSTWWVELLDVNGQTHYLTINYIPSGSVSASISFNDSYYFYPDDVNVTYTLTDSDSSNTYFIDIVGSDDYLTWITLNEFFEIDSSGTDSIVLNIPDYFDYPFYIQAQIYEYSYSDDTLTLLASSSITTYNFGDYWGDYSLSVNDTSVNLGDSIYLNYSISGFYRGKLLLLNPASKTIYQTIFESGNYSDIYTFQDNDLTGHWVVTLYGKKNLSDSYSLLTSVNPIVVSSDTPICQFNKNEYDVNENIYVHLVTSESGSVLRFYDDSEYLTSITLNTVGLRDFLVESGFFLEYFDSYPSTLTASLLDDGSTYNSTCTLVNNFVDYGSFDANVYQYKLGDRTAINASYWLVSSDWASVAIKDSRGYSRVTDDNIPGWNPSYPLSGDIDYSVSTNTFSLPSGNWSLVLIFSNGTEIVLDTCVVSISGVSVDDSTQIGNFKNDIEGLGFEGESGLFAFAFLFIIVVLCCLIVLFRIPPLSAGFVGCSMFLLFTAIGFIPVLYLILTVIFGVVSVAMMALFKQGGG